MPHGEGTYGSQVGRPPKKEKEEVTEEKEENTKSKRVYGRSLLTEK